MPDEPAKLPDAPGEWSVDKIDRLLELLPELEAPGFEAAFWPKLEDRIIDGKRVIPMPYPIYHDAIERMRRRAADGPPMNPYDALPEDVEPGGIPFSVMGTHFPVEYFETASLGQVRRYLILCSRGERFCDGHLEAEFLSGSILAALRRLKALRASM